MPVDVDPDECTCTHDRSWHNPDCEECDRDGLYCPGFEPIE